MNGSVAGRHAFRNLRIRRIAPVADFIGTTNPFRALRARARPSHRAAPKRCDLIADELGFGSGQRVGGVAPEKIRLSKEPIAGSRYNREGHGLGIGYQATDHRIKMETGKPVTVFAQTTVAHRSGRSMERPGSFELTANCAVVHNSNNSRRRLQFSFHLPPSALRQSVLMLAGSWRQPKTRMSC